MITIEISTSNLVSMLILPRSLEAAPVCDSPSRRRGRATTFGRPRAERSGDARGGPVDRGSAYDPGAFHFIGPSPAHRPFRPCPQAWPSHWLAKNSGIQL